MNDTRTTSFSEISTLLRCGQNHKYKYVDRLPTRKRRSAPSFGTIVHAGLEGGLLASCETADHQRISTAKEAAEKLLSSELDTLDPDDLDARRYLQQAPEVAARAISWLNLDCWSTVYIGGGPAVELTLFAHVIPGMRIKSVVDWVARNRETGQCWIFEFKTRAKIGGTVAASLQQTVYQHVLAQNGLELQGSMEFTIRSTMPVQPKLNKPGKDGMASMSRADCATDWATYHNALIRSGLDPDDYDDMRVKLNSKTFFQLTPTFRTTDYCSRVWDRVVIPATKLIKRGTTPIPVLTPFICKTCDYQEICTEELSGYDPREAIIDIIQ